MSSVDVLARASRRSTIGQIAVRAAAGSSAVHYLTDLVRRISGEDGGFARSVALWQQSSMFVFLFENFVFSVVAGARMSVVGTVVLEFGTIVQSSFLYRWLTAEPEQDVILIDLRNTISVGPFLVVLDDVVEAFVGFRPSSRVYSAGVAISDYVNRWPIRATSIVLLAAVASGFSFGVVVGALDEVGLALGVALSLLGVAGLRVDASWDELRETRAVTLLWKVIEPPEPPEPADERRHRNEGSDRATVGVDGSLEDNAEDDGS